MNTEENKNVFKWAKIVLIVLAIFLAVETIGALKSLKNIDAPYNSISVTGEADMTAVPDVATFSFSVSADSKVVSTAQSSVTDKMDKILAGLKGMGIEEKDIKTTNYSVYPKYSYPEIVCMSTYCPSSGRQVQDGYTVSHDVTVKVRKAEDAGKALSLVGESGATNISSISFAVDDPDKLFEEARTLAIEDAKSKAKTLAKELGVRLVRIVSYYDNNGGPMPYYAEGMGGDMVKTMSAVAPTLPAGENKYTANVTIIYEIR